METTIEKDFVYDEVTRIHRYKGEIILSNTQVLQECAIYDLSGIPEAILEKARQRGLAVHAATHYYDEGDLDESTICSKILPYVEAWKQFMWDTGAKWEAIEKPVFSPIYRVCGKPDRVGTINGKRGIFDIKTYEAKDWTALQLAGYALMIDLSLARYAISLLPGKNPPYALESYDDRNDAPVFLSCVNLAYWKRRHSHGNGKH